MGNRRREGKEGERKEFRGGVNEHDHGEVRVGAAKRELIRNVGV